LLLLHIPDEASSVVPEGQAGSERQRPSEESYVLPATEQTFGIIWHLSDEVSRSATDKQDASDSHEPLSESKTAPFEQVGDASHLPDTELYDDPD
jgi:hypothetical protein